MYGMEEMNPKLFIHNYTTLYVMIMFIAIFLLKLTSTLIFTSTLILTIIPTFTSKFSRSSSRPIHHVHVVHVDFHVQVQFRECIRLRLSYR
jgi:hypothetical protein